MIDDVLWYLKFGVCYFVCYFYYDFFCWLVRIFVVIYRIIVVVCDIDEFCVVVCNFEDFVCLIDLIKS